MVEEFLVKGKQSDRLGSWVYPSALQIGKHCAAKHHGIEKRRSIHILDDVGQSRTNKNVANRLDQAWPFMRIPVSFGEIGVCLTRRRGVNGVKRSNEPRVEREGICLNERERIMWLWIYIHANNLEARFAVTNTSAASTTKKIKQPGFSR